MPVNTELATRIWYRYVWCRDNGHADYVKKAEQCDKFFEGDQWTEADRQALKAARRPALTINKIISTIGNVMGEQIYNRSEIAFRPRSGAMPETADVLTKVFKQISDANQLDWKRSDMFTDGIITSRGFLDTRMEFDDSMMGSVKIIKLNSKNVIIDPDADEYDPDTWNEIHVTKWMTSDDIALLYSKKDAEVLRNKNGSTMPYGFDSIESNRDRFGLSFNPAYGYLSNEFYDTTSMLRNLRVIERQYRKLDRQDHFVDPKTGAMRPVPSEWGDEHIAAVESQFGLKVTKKLIKRIRWVVACDEVVLHDDWSPYKHFTVVPYFPIFRNGRTIGLVENLIGSQELLNKVSSQELHVVNTTANSGYKVKTGALATMSIEELEMRGAETGLVIEVTGDLDDVEKITPNPVPTGLDRISYKAEEHIKTISGVSDSQQGMDRADVAAKAIQQKRQASSTNLAKPLDSLVRTDFVLARNILDLVQSYYTEERVMTITHAHGGGEPETFTVNQVTPEGEVVNDLTVGEYDVVVSSVPQRETLEDSQFDQAVAMRKDLGIPIPDAFIIESSRLMNKKDIIKQIQASSQSPEARQQQQLQQEAQLAEIEKTKAETTQKTADSALKQAKAQKEGVAASKEAMTPPEGSEGGVDPAMVKVQAEINLAERKFEHEKEIDWEQIELEKQKIAEKAKLDEKKQAEQAIADRLNRASGPKPQ